MRKIKRLVGTAVKFVFFSLFCILFSACSTHQQNLDHIDTANLTQLENIKVKPLSPSLGKTELSQMRIKSLQDSAMSIGAQGGLALASVQINMHMEYDRKYLDSTFNFYTMVLSHGVLPPVLEEGDNSLNLDDPNTIRVADKTYKIIQQARFASTPPTWREYLWFNFSKPSLPDKTLLPRTEEEQKIWKVATQTGWEKGLEQATSIFQQNLARLKRDFHGMVLYRKLLQEKMISPPFVSRTELGVTGNGIDMRVNDQVLRIVEHPKLQVNAKDWRAVVIKK